MSTATPQSRPSQRTLGLLAAGIFALLLALGAALAGRVNAPDYGAWTGIRPLETKLDMLQAFAAQGEVDALMLGSSITEFGFSASLFSELMSKKLGRPYRAFNFASGGAEPRTLPKLYRLARTVARAKTVFLVVPAEPKLSEKIPLASPDHALMNAPVGLVLDHPLLLNFSRAAWNTPALKKAPALRDLALFGHFKNLAQAVGLESYAIDANGDRLSYLITWKASDLPAVKESGELAVKPFVDAGAGANAAARLDRMLDQYFSRRDIAALEELRELVEKDGAKLHVISHAGAASLWGPPTTNPEVLQGRRDFFAALTSKLGAGFWDVAAVTQVPDYAVSDVTHLNTYGAEIFTRNTFAVATGAALPQAHAMSPSEEIPSLTMFPTKDITFNPVSALIFRPPGEAHPLLKFRTVLSLAVPVLPKDDLFLALRMPDNHDVVVPAAALGPGDFVAEVDLPASAQPQGIILRLLHGAGAGKVALAAPLEDYEWLRSYPRTPLRAALPDSQLQVLALPPVRAPGENLFVATRASSTARPPAQIGLRLAPLAPTQGKRIDLGKPAPVAGQLLQAKLPAALASGDYEVLVYDAASGNVLGKAAPLRIDEVAAYSVPELRIVEGAGNGPSGVRVAWSGVNKPDRLDWIGVFPLNGAREARIDLRYTNGKSSGEMFFALNRPLQRGEYELRLFAAGSWRELAATNPFVVGTAQPEAIASAPAPADAAAPERKPPPLVAAPGVATLTSDPNPRISAGSVKVTWSGITHPSVHDWIGIFPANGKAEDRIDLIVTGGRAAGEARFPISSALAQRIGPGEYEFRLYSGGWQLLARTPRVKFETGVAASTPATVFEAGVPRISVDPNPRIAAGSVKVAWSGIEQPGANDWIGVFPVGGKAEDRLDYKLTGGRGAGELQFPITSALAQRVGSGQYEFRLHRGTWELLARSGPVTFNAGSGTVPEGTPAAPAARLVASPSTPLERNFARVTWTIFGKASDDDWIGLYALNARPEERLDFMPLQGRADGVLEFPISRHIAATLKEGRYEFRLYKRWTLLARSGPMTFTSEKR